MIDRTGHLYVADDSRAPVAAQVAAAVAHYRRKHGHAPTECHLHPAQAAGLATLAGCKVVSDKYIMKQHQWIGIGE